MSSRDAGAAAQRGSPLRRALRRPGFRRLFLAQTASRWGDTFNAVALIVLVFRLTGSGVGVGVTVALEVVPVLLLASWPGRWSTACPGGG